MHTIASHNIPKFFSSYMAVLGYGSNGTTGKTPNHVMQSQYHCHQCNTDFIVNHNQRGGLFYGGSYGEYIIYCPYCGHRHENFSRHDHVYDFSDITKESTEVAPISMDMLLMEYKKGFVLRVKARTLSIRQTSEEDQNMHNHFGNRVEEIRFDLKNRVTTFSILTGSHRTVLKRYELGNPFNTNFYEDSLLRCIRSDNLSEECRTGTTAFLKTLRDSLRAKWMEIHGYDIGSIFVSYGQVHGRLLFPLMNFAFRIRFPDAQNLPQELNDSKTSIQHFMRAKIVTEEAIAIYGSVEPKGNSIENVISAFSLPNTPNIRKLLQDDFFAAPELIELFKVTTNLDLAVQIWNRLHELVAPTEMLYYRESRYTSDIYPFLQKLAEYHSAKEILSMLRRNDWRQIMDTRNMLNRLASERKEEALGIKLKYLHDWLVTALKEQKEKGCRLEAPEAVKKRLAMQMDSIKFFLPEHTKELVSASDELHNCVRTYSERVMNGVCNIVLMTDDRGKLVACLEVAGGHLVQAKLKYNKRVSEDAAINRAVIDWCEKANLKVMTPDVALEEKPAEETAERIAG